MQDRTAFIALVFPRTLTLADPGAQLYGVLCCFVVTLRKNTALLGEGMAFIMLQDGAPGFGDVNRPKPMLLAPSDEDAETVRSKLNNYEPAEDPQCCRHVFLVRQVTSMCLTIFWEQVIADLALSSEFGKSNANVGAVLLSWGAGPKSSMFDLHVQLFVPVHTAIHITGKGGGVVSNTWGKLIPS
jgi:hypothetical protein